MHSGNVAWHGSGCDGAPPADASLDGGGWFAEVWHQGDASEFEGHFAPDMSPDERRLAFDKACTHAPHGSVSLVTDAPMADTLRAAAPVTSVALSSSSSVAVSTSCRARPWRRGTPS